MTATTAMSCPYCQVRERAIRHGKPAKTCCAPECVGKARGEANRGKRRTVHVPRSGQWEWDGSFSFGRPRTTKKIIDDHGELIRIRRCVDCLGWFPLDYEHFSTKGRQCGVAAFDSQCRPCRKAFNDEIRKRRTVEQRKALYRRQWQTMQANPDRLERQRAVDAKWRERNRTKISKTHRAWYLRVMADPERRAQYLANHRAYHARVAAARRAALEADAQLAATPLPAPPLAAAIVAWARRERAIRDQTFQPYALLGIHERIIFRWRTGTSDAIFKYADEILVRIGMFWWEVWNEETLRLPLLTVGTYARHNKRASSSRDEWSGYALTKRKGYGDAGPDVEALERVRQAFEGDPEPAAPTAALELVAA